MNNESINLICSSYDVPCLNSSKFYVPHDEFHPQLHDVQLIKCVLFLRENFLASFHGDLRAIAISNILNIQLLLFVLIHMLHPTVLLFLLIAVWSEIYRTRARLLMMRRSIILRLTYGKVHLII